MKSSTGAIYGLYDIRQPEKRVRYVGQTVLTNPKRRLDQHRHEARSGHGYLAVHRWIRKIGPENVGQVILEHFVPAEELNNRETYWIAEHRTFKDWGEGGLNLTLDGLGSIITDKSRKSQRDAMRLTARQRSDSNLLRNRPNSTPEEVVAEIRHWYASREVIINDLVDEFKIDSSRIRRILLNKECFDPGYLPPSRWRRLSRAERLKRGAGTRKNGLSWDDIHAIRSQWLEGELTAGEIAESYSVHHTTVWHIVNNRTWQNPEYKNTRGYAVPEGVRRRISQTLRGRPKPGGFGKRGESNVRAKITEKQAKEVINLLATGVAGRDIAPKFGITESAVSCIRTGKTWKDLDRPWMENA